MLYNRLLWRAIRAFVFLATKNPPSVRFPLCQCTIGNKKEGDVIYANACAKSSIKSCTSSNPTEMRMMPIRSGIAGRRFNNRAAFFLSFPVSGASCNNSWPRQSFTLPPGFKYSSYTNSRTPSWRGNCVISTIGVLPTSS